MKCILKKKLLNFVLILINIMLINLPFDIIAAQDKPVKLKFATQLPPSYGDVFYSAKRMADYINYHGKKYNLSCEFYHSDTVYKSKAIFPSAMSGTLDIGHVVLPYIEGSIPVVGALSLPFLWDNYFIHREAIRRDKPLFKFLSKKFEENNVVLLIQAAIPSEEVISIEPIKTIDDWKGLKVRTAGVSYSKTIKV